jgi:hypothetical protein
MGVVFLPQIYSAKIYYNCILRKKDFVVNHKKTLPKAGLFYHLKLYQVGDTLPGFVTSIVNVMVSPALISKNQPLQMGLWGVPPGIGSTGVAGHSGACPLIRMSLFLISKPQVDGSVERTTCPTVITPDVTDTDTGAVTTALPVTGISVENNVISVSSGCPTPTCPLKTSLPSIKIVVAEGVAKTRPRNNTLAIIFPFEYLNTTLGWLSLGLAHPDLYRAIQPYPNRT